MRSRVLSFHPSAILRESLRLLIPVCLVLILSPPSAHAQSSCWDCTVWYYPGDDCFIDSCSTTDGAGESNCQQFGDCWSLETCETYGHGCQGDFIAYALSAPDARSEGDVAAPMTPRQVETMLRQAGLETLQWLARSNGRSTETPSLTCVGWEGWMVHARPSPGDARLLRQITNGLVY